MSILNTLDTLADTAPPQIQATTTLQELEDLRVQLLGKKGQLTDILKGMATVSNEERPLIGQKANHIKTQLQDALDQRKTQLEAAAWESELQGDQTDITLPSRRTRLGKRHPTNQTLQDVIACFTRLGFSLKEGPDIETDYYNFEALNIPEHHPARAMHDTFYLNTGYLTTGHVLRTHTSPVQIHEMEKLEPGQALKIIVPGKVYRCDADVTHSPCFHQVEGLYVDKNVSFAQLKGTLSHFLKEMFGAKRQVRFRPSYFPFTEPSTEVDVACFKCSGKGCNLCKQTGWLEILGAGMVNRNVFRSVKLDPDQVTGFAFGLGIERIAMLRYEINDIRLFTENDYRFLEQF